MLLEKLPEKLGKLNLILTLKGMQEFKKFQEALLKIDKFLMALC